MAKYTTVNCEECGAEIERETWRLKKTKKFFCSIECRAAWQASDKNPKRKNKIKICENCSKEFDLRKTNAGWNQRFCSQTCSGEWQSNNIIKEKHLITNTCMHCGIKFDVHPYRKTAKFCSTKCYNEYRRDTIICPICGIQFSSPKWEKRTYCSIECAKHKEINVSSGEIEIREFLSENNIAFDYQTPIHHKLGFYKPDIIVGKKIIEFYGTYWHCHKSIFANENEMNFSIGMAAKEKRIADAKRINSIKDAGYNILIIWEHEWKTQPQKSKQKILNFLKE